MGSGALRPAGVREKSGIDFPIRLKIKNGCCYHGLALNVDLDLSPFDYINPCGYAGLRVTQVRDVGINAPLVELEQQLAQNLIALLQQQIMTQG